MADTTDWTSKSPVVCPDCGYTFGHRSATAELQIRLTPVLAAVCRRWEDKSNLAVKCIRLDDAEAAAAREKQKES